MTGAEGQLGSELVNLARQRGHSIQGLGRATGDLAAHGVVESALRVHHPEVVINCAAFTKVDAAEANPDAAYRDNTLVPRLLAAACQAAGILLVHLSTDFVFDGTARSPVDEWASPRPLGVYGASKLAGEAEIRHLCPMHQIVRTSWLFGGDGPNFVLTILRLARAGGPLRVVADQTGSPTWTGHLAPALLELAVTGEAGTYHLSNQGAVTWHGLAEAVLADSGLPELPVQALTTDQYPTPARRPSYSVLDNRAWRLLGRAPLPAWRDGLRGYLMQRGVAGSAPTRTVRP
ncbi:MAG: dTDP-4-dehydrorhamnose reductase [Candidatus Dormibacteria bacterium]